MHRRSFLAAGLASLSPPLFAGGNHIGRSRLSAITDEIGRTPAASLEFARHYGLQWVEIRDVPGARKSYWNLPAEEAKAAAREFADHGLKVSFFNTPLLKFGLPGTEPVRKRPEAPEDREIRLAREQARFDSRIRDLETAIGNAHVFGVNKLRVFTFSRVEEPARLLPRIAGIIGEMERIAKREGIWLLIENEGSQNVATCAELAQISKLVPSAVGINLDSLNGSAQQEVFFPDGYRLLDIERIGNVQMKGRTLLDYPQKLDWKAIVAALEKDGYQGQLGLETHIFGEGQIQASHDSMKEILRIVGAS